MASPSVGGVGVVEFIKANLPLDGSVRIIVGGHIVVQSRSPEANLNLDKNYIEFISPFGSAYARVSLDDVLLAHKAPNQNFDIYL